MTISASRGKGVAEFVSDNKAISANRGKSVAEFDSDNSC